MGIVERHPTADRVVDGGNGGGDDNGMLERVAKLEAVVPTLATKVDIGELRAELARFEGSIRTDMHKEFTAQTWRIVGALFAFGTAILGVMAKGFHWL